MAEAVEAEKVKFFVGVLAADTAALGDAADRLAGEFGSPCLTSGVMPFRHTAYYEKELGPEPLREFFAFPGGFEPDKLADSKVLTNRLEKELARARPAGPPRPVNLDPGYLAPDKLVLASAKNFSHRIYLSRGIYAEVTLQYRKGVFHSLPWTFPDYASGAYHPFFLALREMLMAEREAWGA